MKPGRRPHDFLELFRSGTWFRALPGELQERLLHAGVLREVKAGQRVVPRGGRPDGLLGLVEGSLRLSSLGLSGQEALLMFLEPPRWVGEMSLFDSVPSTLELSAETASVLVHVPQPALEALLQEHPVWWREIGRLLAQHMRLALLSVEETALLPPGVRLARRLWLIAHHYGEWEQHSLRVIRVSQEQLAMMLSLSRQTANQLLKGLEAQGLLRLRYGEIELLDLDRLRELGELDRRGE